MSWNPKVTGRCPPHFLSCVSLSFMQSCSITEMITHASSVSLNRMNIADIENRSGMTGNTLFAYVFESRYYQP